MPLPSEIPEWSVPDPADITDPAGLKSTGWQSGDPFLRQHANWLFKWISDWRAYIVDELIPALSADFYAEHSPGGEHSDVNATSITTPELNVDEINEATAAAGITVNHTLNITDGTPYINFDDGGVPLFIVATATASVYEVQQTVNSALTYDVTRRSGSFYNTYPSVGYNALARGNFATTPTVDNVSQLGAVFGFEDVSLPAISPTSFVTDVGFTVALVDYNLGRIFTDLTNASAVARIPVKSSGGSGTSTELALNVVNMRFKVVLFDRDMVGTELVDERFYRLSATANVFDISEGLLKIDFTNALTEDVVSVRLILYYEAGETMYSDAFKDQVLYIGPMEIKDLRVNELKNTYS